jgi:PAP2 superfamily
MNDKMQNCGRLIGSIKFILASVLLIVFLLECSTTKNQKILTPHQVATSWADLTIYITKNTPSNSPTFASRVLGYIGVTMYESIVHGNAEYASLAGQLNELDSLPLPQPRQDYNWVLSLNAAQASILRNIYIQTSDANKNKIDSLEAFIYDQFSNGLEKKVASRSSQFGKSIAESIFEWSKTDGGHRGYLQNFDKKYIHPPFPGSWEPPLYAQSFSHYPLHPHWGKNRTFIKANSEMPVPKMIAYSTDPTSDYYKQFVMVYEKSKILTQAEKEAALWWGDDPSDTFTPPGHSYYLASLTIKQQNPSLIICALTFAKTGMAVADAFINCWKWKYHFYSERPSSFIIKNIDERWESFWPDPPFPAFPSGHATQAGAVAEVLTDIFGDNIALTDSSHIVRPRDELRNTDFKRRTFNSFSQLANEIADSRFYGGIHAPQDNEVGLVEGRKMGKAVNQLRWKKEIKK